MGQKLVSFSNISTTLDGNMVPAYRSWKIDYLDTQKMEWMGGLAEAHTHTHVCLLQLLLHTLTFTVKTATTGHEIPAPVGFIF